MTPAELRALVRASRNRRTASTDPYLPVADVMAAKDKLSRLAPQLAVLCADMGEALEYAAEFLGAVIRLPDGEPPTMAEHKARAVLAKLEEL